MAPAFLASRPVPAVRGGHREPLRASRTCKALGRERPYQGSPRVRWVAVATGTMVLVGTRYSIVLSLAETEAGPAHDHLLTPDLRAGFPQIIVPENHWQAARSTGTFTLVSCTVSPGFQFDGFTLAPDGFDIPR